MVRTWLGECCRIIEAEVVSNRRDKFHQTTCKLFAGAQYHKMVMLINYDTVESQPRTSPMDHAITARDTYYPFVPSQSWDIDYQCQSAEINFKNMAILVLV